MSSFLRKNVLCVLSFRAVKKSLLSVEIIQILFFFFFLFLVSFLKKVFSSFKVIVLREAKVNAFQWIL